MDPNYLLLKLSSNIYIKYITPVTNTVSFYFIYFYLIYSI